MADLGGNEKSKERKKQREEATSDETESSAADKYQIGKDLKEKLKDIPEALTYIAKLEKVIKKQLRKINKWKTKIKKLQKPKDASTQTVFQNNVIDNTENSVSNEPDAKKDEAKSLAEDIKEAAEQAMQNSGFVYEETSGMYYDYSTGYYYNAEYGLYYDGTTGTYLKFNQETQSYDFHSQVVTPQPEPESQRREGKVKTKRKKKNGHNTKERKRQRCEEGSGSPPKDVEEGECSESDDASSEEEAADDSDTSDVSKQWPPCMRIIVEASDVPKVKIGSLHIITFDGGTIGREGNHSILIPDLNTSKHHLKVSFDKEEGQYLIVDLGSRNGTFLNAKRLSPSKQESDATVVTHGSKIQIGSTVLLCHIHEGNQTCGHCEPGLLQPEIVKAPVVKRIAKTSRAERHKNELKNLRKICGLSANYEDESKLASGYTDRAQKRRETVGSQNPHEKTKMASLEESISSENRGFKLLSKMGWKEGQSLGKKDGEGIVEPIKVISNKGTTGIGCNAVTAEAAPTTEKQNIWKKTQERFHQLPDSNNAFDEESESS